MMSDSNILLKLPEKDWDLLKRVLQESPREEVDVALRSITETSAPELTQANLFGYLPKTGQTVEDRYIPSGLEVTQRVLHTLKMHWGVKTMLQTSKGLVIVQYPYSLAKHDFSYVWFDLCDNGGEVNVGPINTPERLKPYFPDGIVSVASTATTLVLTAETMAYRIWCAMNGQEIDWNKNDMIPAHPYKEPLQMIGAW
jgi:hypothetical protein